MDGAKLENEISLMGFTNSILNDLAFVMFVCVSALLQFVLQREEGKRNAVCFQHQIVKTRYPDAL